jgi:acyl dehydratase
MYGVAASTHGNWAASIALMDRAILPRPPLVAVKSLNVRVVDLVGPGAKLSIRSKILDVKDQREPFKVTVAITIKSLDGRVLATAECAYEKIGAVRSMR